MIKLNKRNKIILAVVITVLGICLCGAAFGNESSQSQITPVLTLPSSNAPKATTSISPSKTVVKSSPKPSPKPKKITKPKIKKVFYSNCTEARNAGATPLIEGQPGYRPKLDRNSDGIACE